MSMGTPSSQDRHEPFDSEEANAARAYRALPGGEPSEELDARILAAARTTMALPRRRPRPWYLSAGFGVAAATVMAAGIGWQLGWLGGVPGNVTMPAATQRSDAGAAARQQPARAEEVERVDIDLIMQERKAQDLASKPAAPEPAATPAAPPAPAAPEFRRRDNASPPPAASDDLRDAAPVVRSEPTPQPFPAESEASSEADAELDATAPAGSAREQTTAAPRQDTPVAARSAELAKQIALPPWSEDAALDPEAWLERIRERVRQGDRQGAEFSLRRFVLMHPRRAVPRELQRLLVE